MRLHTALRLIRFLPYLHSWTLILSENIVFVEYRVESTRLRVG